MRARQTRSTCARSVQRRQERARAPMERRGGARPLGPHPRRRRACRHRGDARAKHPTRICSRSPTPLAIDAARIWLAPPCWPSAAASPTRRVRSTRSTCWVAWRNRAKAGPPGDRVVRRVPDPRADRTVRGGGSGAQDDSHGQAGRTRPGHDLSPKIIFVAFPRGTMLDRRAS